ncbi:glycoprotein 3-alpha-L-fucosyltransferase A isoform X2 [Cloeon dipterum]|uniref:glycoprotein 3-alpha-L-fucosyltransferase A isoform X2 n=1 Tax=Cloeon dipterum TaxID=197152 RepID=UPI0032208DA3
MAPRVSLRRCFLALLGLTCFLFLVLNVHQKEAWARSLAAIQQQVTPSSGSDQSKDSTFKTSNSDSNKLQGHQKTQVTHQAPLPDLSSRPWFMAGGERRPVPARRGRSGRRLAHLWPAEDPNSDRVSDQLMFVPPIALANESSTWREQQSEGTRSQQPLKRIVLYNGLSSWNVKSGRDVFLTNKCPVDTCTITTNKAEVTEAEAVLFKDHFPSQANPWRRPPHQVWILYFLECPYHTQHVKYSDLFNWTATYRRDSDLVAPYERWTYFDEKAKRQPPGSQAASINYAANKTKQVAWFVSNCGARNNRLQYARELSKYISVDVYGACGTKKCPRTTANKCFEMLDKDYKFYLAFENSNCKDYITEKFFVNGLGHNVIPIVMGARPEDYEKSAPLKSYIHVDEFATPRELAAYLHRLDADDELYNEYFRWKGTGEFINTYFFCRLCALLNDPEMPHKSYRDVNDWWRGPGTCITGSWRQHRPPQPSLAPHALTVAANDTL